MMSDLVISTAARRFCTVLGVDPDQEIVCGLMETLTPAERLARAGVGGDANLSIKAQRWQLFRHAAAMHLAGTIVAESLRPGSGKEIA